MAHFPYLEWVLAQVLIISRHLGVFITLTFILFVLQSVIFKLSYQLFGRRVVYISAWIGTPVHELSHALFCLLFGHKIKKMVLFRPDKQGLLGSVTHSYNRRNPWQVMGNFMIGIAPLFGGLCALYLLTLSLLTDSNLLIDILTNAVFSNVSELTRVRLIDLTIALYQTLQQIYNTSPIRVFLWGYFCAAISLHLLPSAEDLKGVWRGFGIALILCVLLMLIDEYFLQGMLSGITRAIDLTAMLYFIAIILTTLLLFFLLVVRVLMALVMRR